MKLPEIFVSYSWSSKKYADKIYNDLTSIGFNVIKDDHTLKYANRISDFMKKIRKSDFALLLICDNYLKSLNCMTEVMHLEKDDDIWDKLLPVVCRDAKIYELSDRINYVKYWEERTLEIEKSLENMNPINATSLYQELKTFREITQNIDFFLCKLKDILNVAPEELFDKFYSPITQRIGVVPDYSKIIGLLKISLISNPEQRLRTINIYMKNHNLEYSYCYSLMASCYFELGKTKEAILFFKKSIKLDDFNYSAWNNLGEVYRLKVFNYFEAKKAYEKAIECKPDLDIPRLNLGVVLSQEFKDFASAKKQYEEILKFDENNPSAHHNLSNIYKIGEFYDLDKCEKHLIIAVNQNHLDATISYANFLKVFKKDIEGGNKFYEIAKKLDIDNVYGGIIDALIKSPKG